MEAILANLDIDSSFFYQFAVFTFIFIILSKVVFEKLQDVVELRENNTVGLDEGADKKFDQVQELEEKYRTMMDEAYGETQTMVNSEREKIIKREKELLKKEQEVLNKAYEEKRNKVLEEVDGYKTNIMATSEELTNDLVNKLLK
jgi:F0F1-type ATP synthase membrane subunit b/b'